MALQGILSELDELTVAQRVTRRHDEARASFHLDSVVVRGDEDFRHVVVKYMMHHIQYTGGGTMSRDEAWGRARKILERGPHGQTISIATVVTDAANGQKGSMPAVLDRIADSFKSEAVEHYYTSVFDRHIGLTSLENQVAIIKQLRAMFGSALPDWVHHQPAESLARDYREFVRAIVQNKERMSETIRRI